MAITKKKTRLLCHVTLLQVSLVSPHCPTETHKPLCCSCTMSNRNRNIAEEFNTTHSWRKLKKRVCPSSSISQWIFFFIQTIYMKYESKHFSWYNLHILMCPRKTHKSLAGLCYCIETSSVTKQHQDEETTITPRDHYQRRTMWSRKLSAIKGLKHLIVPLLLFVPASCYCRCAEECALHRKRRSINQFLKPIQV